MTFTDISEVIKIVKDNQQLPKWIVEARKEHKTLKALVYGEDFKSELLRIEHIESEKRAASRKKYSRPIKAHIQRLLILIDNVYSATGGSKVLKDNLSEKQKQQLLEKVNKIRDNKSLEKFLETYWAKDLYIVDPNGVLFTEYKGDDLSKLKPTYKSIDAIRNYESNGQKLEWILFEPIKSVLPDNTFEKNKTKEIFRFVDDKREYYILKDGEKYTELEQSFDHPFGIVPGVTCSDKQILGRPNKLSFIHSIKEDLQETLRDQSVLTIYKFQNGFPIPYRPRVICPQCNGTMKDGSGKCGNCDGKGVLLTKDVTDEIILPVSIDGEVAQLPSNFAGYVSPPLNIWDQYIKELNLHEEKQLQTLWGASLAKQPNETATGRWIDTQPITNTLTRFSGVAEFMEHFFIEMTARVMFELPDDQKSVSIIMYGKRFIIEPIDVLLMRYTESRKSENPATLLDEQIIEYLTGKYKNDIVTLRQELNKIKVEPYPHYNVDTVAKTLGAVEARKKIMFSQWWSLLDENEKNQDFTLTQKQYNNWFKLNDIKLINPEKDERETEE